MPKSLDDCTNQILGAILSTPSLDEAMYGEGDKPRLLEYRHVWTGRDRSGDPQYEYYCRWSDGSAGMSATLPWDRMAGAVELPMDSRP